MGQHLRTDDLGLFDRAGITTAEAGFELLTNVLESATEDSVIATDCDGDIVLWNEGARRLHGYAADEVLGRHTAFLHTPEDAGGGLPEQMMRSALADGKWAGPVQRVRKDGTHFTASVVITPRLDRDEQLVGFVLVSRDVTEQIQLTRDLEQAQSYARSLIECAPDAMVIVNADGLIRLANAETEKLFGYDSEELVGRPVEILIPERFQGQHPAHRANFFAAPRARAMGAGLELRGRRENGTEFPVEISLSPLRSEDELFVTAAIRDVTERKRAEQDLVAANAGLEAASRAKNRFLASMSHELRTPLNAILGFAGTLLMELPGQLNEEQTKQLRIVRSSGRHLLSLINDLLDLARIEAGKLELHLVPIDLAELLDEVAVTLGPLAKAKGLALEVAPSSVSPITSDRRALRQILLNLANNAIKFTDEGSVRLVLTRELEDGHEITRVAVVDTGHGIRDEDQERLFAAFEQIGGTTAQPYEGTGLGLYICQTMAPLLGATITFESEFGSGTTFTLDLRSGDA
jgi:PAS domain S-box-containing protein